MTKLNQVYKCEVCGNIVEMLHTGVGELVCCGKPMVLQEEKSKDEGMEKHIPVITQTVDEIKVIVGSTPHPMETEHFIEWIEIIADGRVYRQDLSPESKPEAEFCVKAEKVSARAYCNVHGLWKSE